MLNKQFEKGEPLNGKTYMEERWKEYEEFIIPPEASDVQRDECKQAFILGMATLFSAFTHDPEESFGDQEAFGQFLEDLHETMDVYLKDRLVKLAVEEAKGIFKEGDPEPTMQ